MAVSGSGNVAQFAVQKLIELGAKVLTMSDSSGYVPHHHDVSVMCVCVRRFSQTPQDLAVFQLEVAATLTHVLFICSTC